MVTFRAGAFKPVSLSDSAPVADQYAAIAGGSTAWLVANALFLFGAAVTRDSLRVRIDRPPVR